MRAIVPALVALMLALPGCTTTPLAPPAENSHAAPRGCPNGSARWWRCLGDAQLSALIERALAALPTPALTSAQHNLTATIARRYIALRAQQTALVLLAAREELDSQLAAMAGQPVAASAVQLAVTRADQTRTRSDIAALRVELAVLTGSAADTIDKMPSGSIPLPTGPLPGVESYDVAQVAEAHAQSEALSAIAAAQTLRARTAGPLPKPETLAADRRALAALQSEEQARAAMTQAYVLALSRDPATR